MSTAQVVQYTFIYILYINIYLRLRIYTNMDTNLCLCNITTDYIAMIQLEMLSLTLLPSPIPSPGWPSKK